MGSEVASGSSPDEVGYNAHCRGLCGPCHRTKTAARLVPMREEQRSVVAEFRSESMRGADEAGYLGDGSNDAVGDRERAAYFARVMERD